MALPNKQSYTTEDIYSLPDGQRAELIDGTMYMMAPPNRIHQKLVSELTQVIGNHIKSKKGSCEIYPAPFAVFLNADEKKLCRTGYQRNLRYRQTHGKRVQRRAELDH